MKLTRARVGAALILAVFSVAVWPISARAQSSRTSPLPPPVELVEKPAYTPPGPSKSVEIGNFYLKRKKYRAAVSRFEEAAQTRPDYAPAYLGLGKAYEQMGSRKQALDAYQKYLDLLPSDKDAEDAKDVQRAVKRLRGEGPG